jgi:predicted ATP-grasp superfamily ATP-dependent carboligase
LSTEAPAITVVLTGGRAPVTLELARLLNAGGYRVCVAESQERYLCRSSRAVSKTYPVRPPSQDPVGFAEDLENILITEKASLLVPTCEEVFYVSRARERLSRHCQVLVDSQDLLAILHNKWAFNQKVQTLGLRVPRTILVKSVAELESAIGQFDSFVLKPIFSRFGSKTLIVRSRAKHPNIESVTPTVAQPWIVQEFIEGREFCSYSVVKEGKILAHVTYDHRFTAGLGAGICFESVDHPEIFKWISQFVGEIGFTGQIAFDFIETKSGEVYPLECNPRATSGAHLFSVKDDIGRALFGTASETILIGSGRIGKIGLAMWIYGLASLRSARDLSEWIKVFRRGREVVFAWNDPLPFFEQFFYLAGLWRKSLKLKASMLEVSTLDIEWNGAE